MSNHKGAHNMAKITVTDTPRFPGIPSGGKSVTFDGRLFQILFDGEVVEWIDERPVPSVKFDTVAEALAFLREYAAAV